ncbi:MAG: manganese efflux pump [Bacteroidales bacterium]|nr:manganese efflux pump [Bacteroidales bacterium]
MDEILSYSILLAFGLSSDLLFLAVGAGVAMHPYSVWLNLKAALVFGLVQILMAVLGINVGFFVSDLIPDFNYYLGLVLIAFVGLKFLLETNKIQNESRTFLIEDRKILWSLSFASSFNSFIAYTGFGLMLVKYSMFPIIGLAAFVFLSVLVGVFIGNKYRPEHLGRFSKFFGGIILIFLAIYLMFH